MFIKLNKVNKGVNDDFYLSEVRVNVSHISFIAENQEVRNMLVEGKINMNLNKMARFSDVSITGPSGRQTITVVGEPEVIESKIISQNKQLLRG